MSEFPKRGLGSWAQYRRRKKREPDRTIIYVTCFKHQTEATCYCPYDEDERQWFTIHGAKEQIMSHDEVAQRTSGVPTGH